MLVVAVELADFVLVSELAGVPVGLAVSVGVGVTEAARPPTILLIPIMMALFSQK